MGGGGRSGRPTAPGVGARPARPGMFGLSAEDDRTAVQRAAGPARTASVTVRRTRPDGRSHGVRRRRYDAGRTDPGPERFADCRFIRAEHRSGSSFLAGSAK